MRNPFTRSTAGTNIHDEAMQRFFDGTYAGDYETGLIAEFEKLLPETPPWKS